MKVSVIFPHTRTDWLFKRAYESIKAQTHDNFEILHDSLKDSPGMAINRCIDRASGDLLTWSYDDDYDLPNKLEIFAMYAEKYPDIDIFYGGHWAIGIKNNLKIVYIPRSFDFELLKVSGNYISTVATAVRRERLGDIRFRLDYPLTDEYVFWVQCHRKGLKFMRIAVPLCCVTHWSESRTYKYHGEKLDEHKKIQKEFGKDFYSKRSYKYDNPLFNEYLQKIR